MEEKVNEQENNTEKEKIQKIENEIALNNTNLDQPPSSIYLLNNPSDFIISQTPLDDLREYFFNYPYKKYLQKFLL